MIFHREEQAIQQEPRDGAGLVQSRRFNERSEPAAVIGEVEEFLHVAERELWLKRLALADHEAVPFQDVEHFLAIAWALHGLVKIELGRAEYPAEQAFV